VAKLGFVDGVGKADPANPRYNLTDSPYWTDGMRAVFVFSEETTALNELEFFDWKRMYQKVVPKPAKKEVPIITFKNLSPPFKDYDYFQNHQQYPFRFNATLFNLINAWWLAEVSTLVYADPDFVGIRFREAGFPEVRFFDKQSTQCYVANNDRFAIVAFRGSEIWKKDGKFDLNKVIADLKADVDIRLTEWLPGGKVHRGFKEALEQVWPDLLPHITQLESRGCKIWITGHSLGAALATLCAGRYGNVQGVYSFGSPRVGDDEFKENLDVNIYRVVNNDDIFCQVPPRGRYVHVGELKFIDRDGIMQDKRIARERSEYQRPDERYGQDDTRSQNKNSFKGFVPAAFRDHVPLLYAVHIWNNIALTWNGIEY
ncbi:MAG: lipase family protein, partial [Desulfobacterales bacterium]